MCLAGALLLFCGMPLLLLIAASHLAINCPRSIYLLSKMGTSHQPSSKAFGFWLQLPLVEACLLVPVGWWCMDVSSYHTQAWATLVWALTGGILLHVY